MQLRRCIRKTQLRELQREQLRIRMAQVQALGSTLVPEQAQGSILAQELGSTLVPEQAQGSTLARELDSKLAPALDSILALELRKTCD